MKPFLWRWLVSTLAVLVAVRLVPGIEADGIGAVLLAALFLGIINALVRPVLLILSIPFILLTAYGLEIEDEALHEAGVTAVMSKPFSPRELLARVSELLAPGQGAAAPAPGDVA